MTTANTTSVHSFKWDNFQDTAMGRYLFRHEYTFIRRFLSTATKPRRLLEIGCGSGRLTRPLRDIVPHIVGLDIDPVALTAFQQKSKAVPLIMGDARYLSFTENSFDCVIAIQTLGYFDHYQFLRACNRVLCNDGLLIFDSVNRCNYKRMLKRLLGQHEELPLGFNLSCHQVLRATTDYGFEIQAVRGYNWLPFDRLSNSALVGIAARIEQLLRLDYCYSISPLFLIAARKRKSL